MKETNLRLGKILTFDFCALKGSLLVYFQLLVFESHIFSQDELTNTISNLVFVVDKYKFHEFNAIISYMKRYFPFFDLNDAKSLFEKYQIGLNSDPYKMLEENFSDQDQKP